MSSIRNQTLPIMRRIRSCNMQAPQEVPSTKGSETALAVQGAIPSRSCQDPSHNMNLGALRSLVLPNNRAALPWLLSAPASCTCCGEEKLRFCRRVRIRPLQKLQEAPQQGVESTGSTPKRFEPSPPSEPSSLPPLRCIRPASPDTPNTASPRSIATCCATVPSRLTLSSDPAPVSLDFPETAQLIHTSSKSCVHLPTTDSFHYHAKPSLVCLRRKVN
ncbi:hypothetical protein N657DRAFT_305573 [Parathielavia appendiculata]|uniref:Uncharacterized protein n=1 Tax=Parathielavia appendiculata TaxID=2587402 RepID=A0AAN6U4N1_9PEZI|nr:hypothetical protein N657DRAFT_305573 [Parathielavia appendiculata]